MLNKKNQVGNTACNSTIGPLHAVDMVYKNRFFLDMLKIILIIDMIYKNRFSKHAHITNLREIIKAGFCSFLNMFIYHKFEGNCLKAWRWIQFESDSGVNLVLLNSQMTANLNSMFSILHFQFSSSSFRPDVFFGPLCTYVLAPVSRLSATRKCS